MAYQFRKPRLSWMLDDGCLMLDDGFWMLDDGCLMLDDGFWMLDDGFIYLIFSWVVLMMLVKSLTIE